MPNLTFAIFRTYFASSKRKEQLNASSLCSCYPDLPQQHRENLTGTRGAYRPYSTVGPKIHDWQPKVAARNGGGSETVDGA